MKMRRSLFAALVLLGTTATHVAAATTWLVPGDGSNTCTTISPNCDTIALAVTASTAGDTISITAASTPVTATVNLNKQLTVAGAGIGATTVLTTAGIAAFEIRADGIVIQDLTISGGTTGVRFPIASTGTAVTNVGFSGQTSRGIDITTIAGPVVADVAITGSAFATSGAIGIRMASTSTVNGLSIATTSFTGNQYGIYQANEGNSSTLTGLAVDDCTFTGNTFYAIYAEEMTASSIEDSTFTGGGNGILIIKFSAANATPVSDIGIRRNTLSGQAGTSIELQMRGMGLGTPGITVEGNTITKDVGLQTTPSSTAVFVRLHPTLANGQVDILDNTITLTGTYGVGTQTHGVQLIGNGPVVLTGNAIDGGSVGGSGTAPASSGVYVQAKSPTVTTAATASFTGSCNRIQNFHNGVSVFDAVAVAYGGLDPAATVSFENNAIEDNDQAQVANGATPTLDFESNWWGCASGCDATTGAVDTDPVLVAPPACVDCQVDADCDDGDVCTGVETCNIGTNQCETTADPFCGDGTTDGACGETCDDGNMTSNDGCSATCQPEFVCTPTPLVGCRTSPTGKSQLQLKKKGDVKDQAQWKWGSGAITPKADFGTPATVSTTDYQFCIYANGALVSRAFVPSGGTCAGKPCWKENSKGFQYKDKDATSDGVTQLKLKEGLVAGKAQIQLKAKGSNIDMPTLPLGQPALTQVLVQIRNSNGVCWESTHTAPAAKNDTVQYKDKNG